MEMIWTKEELKRMKPILGKISKKTGENQVLNDLLDDLLKIQDESIINEVLSSIEKLKEFVKNNSNNPMFLGFVSNISRLDTTDRVSIFEIFNEILAEYNRIISKHTKNICDTLGDQNLISEQMNLIKNTDGDTDIEKAIKRDIQNAFSLTNGITNHEMFLPLINEYNNLLKHSLLIDLNRRLSSIKKVEIRKKTYDCDDFRGSQFNSIRKVNDVIGPKHHIIVE